MDRTSPTAMLKPLERRGLVTVCAGEHDRRARYLTIKPEGATLNSALPVWRETHAALDHALRTVVAARLRSDLVVLSASQQPTGGPRTSS
jgi:DNA-binding MarR family transcriptional regulator